MLGITTADRDRIDLDEISVVQLCDRHDCSCRTRVAHRLRIERVEAGPALDVDDVRSDLQHISGCGACRAQRREHVLERLVHLVLEWKMRGVRAVGSDAELARYEHQVTKADRVAVVAARSEPARSSRRRKCDGACRSPTADSRPVRHDLATAAYHVILVVLRAGGARVIRQDANPGADRKLAATPSHCRGEPK